MPPINFSQAEFVRSAAKKEQFIQSSCRSVVFAGKSNVGKSSVINCLLNRKNFAHTGNTPGKTVHINYFLVGGALYFVDLPGYGFAKVAKTEKERWAALLEEFFSQPQEPSLGVLIVDARHAPTEDDCQMAGFFAGRGIPFVVLANKLDKLKKSEVEASLSQIRKALNLQGEEDLIAFSAEKGTGRELLLARMKNL